MIFEVLPGDWEHHCSSSDFPRPQQLLTCRCRAEATYHDLDLCFLKPGCCSPVCARVRRWGRWCCSAPRCPSPRVSAVEERDDENPWDG